MKIQELVNEVKLNPNITKDDMDISRYQDVLGKQVLSNDHPLLIIHHIIATTAYGKVAIANVRTKQIVLVGIDKDGTATVIVDLKANGKAWQVASLIAKNGNTFPANKVYAAFVKAGNMLVSGSQQSLGGLAVWKKLSRESGISVYGWNTSTKKPINLGDTFDDDSDTHASMYAASTIKYHKILAAKDGGLSKKDSAAFDAEAKHAARTANNVLLVATKA